MRTQKFVSVRQNAREDYGAYLLRVEKLSRSLDCFSSETKVANDALQEARTHLSVALAFNCLRDQVLCRELIARYNLDWETHGNILRSRAAAQDSIVKT